MISSPALRAFAYRPQPRQMGCYQANGWRLNRCPQKSSDMSRKLLFRLTRQCIHRQRTVFLFFHRASFFDSGVQISGYSYF